MLSALSTALSGRTTAIYDHIIVDEAQDVGVADLRLLAVLGGGRPEALFFAGDLGQRIFQPPFSWKTLGVDVRGRSRTLRINYRTSHQIRAQADRLLGPEIGDVDGNVESRTGTVSVFNGPPPLVEVHTTQQEEIEAVGAWLRAHAAGGVKPDEMGVFVRSDAEIERAVAAALAAGLRVRVLDEKVSTAPGHVSVGTMHLVKGLEFRTVVVMACDDDVIPALDRLESPADESDRTEVYNSERHLLYVACTRARDHLLVTGAGRASEFLDDIRE